MKKEFVLIAICAVLATALVGCGSTDNTAQSTNGSAVTQTEQKNQNSGDIGPYHFEISNTARAESITEGEAIVIKYSITNNSDVDIQPGRVSRLQVFQNGVSLSGISIIGASDGKLMDNETKTIQPGATIEVEHAFILDDTSRPVNVSLQLKAVKPNTIKLIDGMLKTDITLN